MPMGASNITVWDPGTGSGSQSTANQLGHLAIGDFEKYGPRGTNEFPFWFTELAPTQYIRGEVAASWAVENPLTLVVKIKPGIMWAECATMKSRELTADDVAYTFNDDMANPELKSDQWWFADKVDTRDKYTAVFHWNQPCYQWEHNLLWGRGSLIFTEELNKAGATDWKNQIGYGFGAWLLTDFVDNSRVTYKKNPNWFDGTAVINGNSYHNR
jgi:ABC-type transport system substrate-binding protein